MTALVDLEPPEGLGLGLGLGSGLGLGQGEAWGPDGLGRRERFERRHTPGTKVCADRSCT